MCVLHHQRLLPGGDDYKRIRLEFHSTVEGTTMSGVGNILTTI